MMSVQCSVVKYKVFNISLSQQLLVHNSGLQSMKNMPLNLLCSTSVKSNLSNHTNLLVTEHKGRTGEYWPKVMAVWTEQSVRSIQKRQRVTCTWAMLFFNFLAFDNKIYRADDHFMETVPMAKS